MSLHFKDDEEGEENYQNEDENDWKIEKDRIEDEWSEEEE